MKRVLMVIPDHEYGGEENRSHRIYKGLKQCGLNVGFVTESSKYEFDKGDLITLPGLNKAAKLPFNVVKLYFLVKKFDADVVLLFKRKSAFLGWVLEKLIPKPKFVFNVANAWTDKKTLWKFCPEYICTLSGRLVPSAVQEARNVKQIRIGVPISLEANNGKEVFSKGKLRLISVGKLNEQKNHVKLIEIAAELRRLGHDCIVDIAGDGPLRKAVENKAKELGVELHLRGHVTEMTKFYDEGGVYIQASNYEGMPNALLEAGQYGLPIVANDVGATADLVDSGTGWLIKSESPSAYAAALVSILSDPEEAARRVKNMQHRVFENYNVEVMNRTYFEYVMGL